MAPYSLLPRPEELIALEKIPLALIFVEDPQIPIKRYIGKTANS